MKIAVEKHIKMELILTGRGYDPMKKETKLFHKLRDKLTHVLLQPIETTTGVGIPDVFFQYNKAVSGWMELKQFKMPVRATTKVTIPYEPGQYGWARKYMKKGGLILLVCQTDEGLYCFVGDSIQDVYTSKEDFYLKVDYCTCGLNGEHFTTWLASLR